MGHFLGGANVVGANVTGASVASCGAIDGGAIVGGAIVGGATVGGATVGGAPVGGAFDVGANVAEQMSLSNCRVLRSKCRRSNRRWSMCHGTQIWASFEVWIVVKVRNGIDCAYGTCESDW